MRSNLHYYARWAISRITAVGGVARLHHYNIYVSTARNENYKTSLSNEEEFEEEKVRYVDQELMIERFLICQFEAVEYERLLVALCANVSETHVSRTFCSSQLLSRPSTGWEV